MAGVKDNATAAVADDVALLKRMLVAKDSYIAELEKRNGLLAEQVELLRKYRFARSSEKWSEEDKRQRWIFDEAETVVAELPSAAEEERFERISYKRRKRRGRRALPAHLPRTEILHELSEEQRRCGIEGCERYGECTKLRPLIGEDVREELEFVPAHIEVKRHRYRRYGQIACERAEVDEQRPAVISAPREKRIVDGGIVTPSLLSHIIVNKFVDALPFYRQERIFCRLGIWIPRQSMCNWTIQASRACGEYLDLLARRIREGPLINMDESPLQVLHEPGRSAQTNSYMWVMVGTSGEGHRVALYTYSPHRSAAVAESLLEGYQGSLQTDGYAGYNSVGAWKGVWHVGCLQHARHHFYEAHVAANKKGNAKIALRYVKELYRIEDTLRSAQLPPDRFVLERRRQAAPVFRKFKKWLGEMKTTVVPKSLLGQAVSYALDDYKRLVRYLKYHYLTPDNNVAENGIRPYAVGRRNWLFNNTPLGAYASAGMYSLVETARINNLDPSQFLRRLFSELPHADTEEKLTALLPWNMQGLPPYQPPTRDN